MRYAIGFIIALAAAAGCGVPTTAVGPAAEAAPTPRPAATRTTAKAEARKKMDKENLIGLEAEASVVDGRLEVRYHLENLSDRNVYVWDLMIGYSGNEQVIDDDGAYVFFDAPDTVRVVRGDLELPSNIDVARKEIPFVRLLGPRQKADGHIRLDQPVTEFSPFYPPPAPENTIAVKCSSVLLQIGYTEEHEGMKITEREVGGRKVLALRGGWEGPYQRIAEKKMPAAVELITYKTGFERGFIKQQ